MKLKDAKGNLIKLPKDKLVNARVNSEIYNLIKLKGDSIQRILDRYIKRGFEIAESGEIIKRGEK